MPERRTIVLALVHYYLPGFKAGGPVRSISNLVERLGSEFDLRIITADRDFRDDTPYKDVVIDGWNRIGNAQVYYLSAGVGALRSLLRLISDTPRVAPIVIAQDLPPLPDEGAVSNGMPEREANERLRLVFLARISPSKNLYLALRILTQVRSAVDLSVYGPIDDKAYWRTCQRLITELPANVSVRYEGVVAHSAVANILKSYDLLFLPTRSENYGHVIIESMLAGTPVLIADTTPWRDLEKAGVGWDLPLENEVQFAKKIDEAARLIREGAMPSRTKVQSYARDRVLDPTILSANRHLFLQAATSD